MMRATALLACVAVAAFCGAVSAAPQTASTVCVYNDAAFVLNWKLKDLATNQESSSTSSYPVWQSKCISATAAGANVTAGQSLVPVVSAVLGKTVTVKDSVLYDPINATSINYICKGTTLDFSCSQTAAPLPTPKDIAKAMGQFFLGFVEGLGQEIGFTDCLQDLADVYQDVKSIVDFIQTGINGRVIPAIAKGFELLGDLLKDVSKAITACVKDAEAFAKKMSDLASALSGNVFSIIKVVIDELVHIWHDRAEITTDSRQVVTAWRGGDYEASGKGVGDIVGIILAGL